MGKDVMQGAAGLRVLEVSTGLAGTYGGFLLASQGADVCVATDGRERDLDEVEAAYFDRGKRVVVEPEGVNTLLPLADVVITDMPFDVPGLPLHEGSVQAGKVIVAISPFGLEGPNSAYAMEDITMWASGGLAYVTRKDESDGSIDQERPRQAPGRQPEMLGGIAGATAAIVGAIHVSTSGEGALADVSMQEVQAAAMLQQHLPPYVWTALVQGKPGSRQRIGVLLPAADGDWYLRPYNGAKLFELAGYAELLNEPWTETMEGLHENVDLIVGLLSEWGVNHKRDWIANEAQKRRVPVAIPRNLVDLLGWDHLQARDYWDMLPFNGREVRIPMAPMVGVKRMEPVEKVPLSAVKEGWSA